MSWNKAVLYRCLVDQRTILVLPSNRVTILGSVESCGVCRITCYSNYSRCPTCESVGVLRGILFNRISMSRYNAVLNRCLVNQTTEFILPCDSITVLGSVEGRTVSRITCNSNYCRIPACKSIGVLRGILFNRISMSRYNAVLNRCLVNQTTEFILPCDSITVLGSVEGRTISCITCYCNNCRIPACKSIGVLCGILFNRISMGRNIAVLYSRLVN